MENYFVELLQKKVDESESLNESESKNEKKKLKISTVFNFIKKLDLSENVCFVFIIEMNKPEDKTETKSDVAIGIKFIDEWMGNNKQMKTIRKKLESVFGDKINLFIFPNYSSEPEKNKCEEMIETVRKTRKLHPNDTIFYVPNEKKEIAEKWSEKYKRSIDCSNPKGFSQRAHCQGRKKT